VDSFHCFFHPLPAFSRNILFTEKYCFFPDFPQIATGDNISIQWRMFQKLQFTGLLPDLCSYPWFLLAGLLNFFTIKYKFNIK